MASFATLDKRRHDRIGNSKDGWQALAWSPGCSGQLLPRSPSRKAARCSRPSATQLLRPDRRDHPDRLGDILDPLVGNLLDHPPTERARSRIPLLESVRPPFSAQMREEAIGRKETSGLEIGRWALDEWRLEGGDPENASLRNSSSSFRRSDAEGADRAKGKRCLDGVCHRQLWQISAHGGRYGSLRRFQIADAEEGETQEETDRPTPKKTEDFCAGSGAPCPWTQEHREYGSTREHSGAHGK